MTDPLRQWLKHAKTHEPDIYPFLLELYFRRANHRIGYRLKVLREAAELTQLQLAAKMGKSEAQVSHWETDRRYPEYENLLLLVEAIGCRLEDVL